MHDLVDVIVPTHNPNSWFRSCVESILRQSYRDLRLIIVDDGSSPAIEERMEKASYLRDDRCVLLRKEHGGVASARNLGLDVADARYVLFVDSDDVLHNSGVESLLGALHDPGSKADVAAGGWRDFGPAKRQRITHRPTPVYDDAYANFVHCGWVTGSIMHRNRPGTRFNTARMPWEAHEFYLDYLAPGGRAVYVDSVIINVRQHCASSRLTYAHNHFEPFQTGIFFADKKRDLKRGATINLEREAALDARIVSCIHALLRQNRLCEAESLFQIVNWGLVAEYRWVRPGSFAWFCRRLGFHVGARGFIAVNRLIGRA